MVLVTSYAKRLVLVGPFEYTEIEFRAAIHQPAIVLEIHRGPC